MLAISGTSQIPNPSFEVWDDVTHPTGWFAPGNTSMSYTFQERVTNAHHGEYALKSKVVKIQYTPPYPVSTPFLSGNISNTYIPCMGNPTKLSGWYIFSNWVSSFLPPDTFVVAVKVRKGNTIIGEGRFASPKAEPTYALFDVPINYSINDIADSYSIAFSINTGSTFPSSYFTYFIIDDLSLDVVTDVPKYPNIENQVTIFPQPSKDDFFINGLNSPYFMVITNMHGESVKELSIEDPQQSIHVGDLQSGVYLMYLKDNLRSWHLKLIKE